MIQARGRALRPAKLLGLFLFASMLVRAQNGTDTVLLNGRIFTGAAGKWAEALAISGARIQAVGSTKEIRALAGPSTRVVDLGGRLVVPGFNDAHVHFGSSDAERINIVAPNDASAFAKPVASALSAEPTCEAVLTAVKDAIRQKPQGKPLVVRIDWRAFWAPECAADSLDRIAPDRPVLLRTFTAHAAIVNGAAARYFRVRADDPPVVGGFFGKDMKSERWDGVVHEYANFRLTEKLLLYDERELRAFLAQAARFGITTLQIMSWNDPAPLVKLLDSIDPGLRIRIISFPIPSGRVPPHPEFPQVPRRIADRVSVSGFKIIIDGTFVEHSAATRVAYSDTPGDRGRVTFSSDELKSMFLEARNRKQQLILHICGDRAIDTVLAVMEQTGGKDVWADQRVRFEHANQLRPDQFQRAKELGVVAVMNPPHLMMGDTQLVRSVEKAGIPLVFASDNAMNPFLNLSYATTYPRNSQEAIGMEQAVRAYTYLPAYAEFAEKEKGTLETGKLADLAVLSSDIFDTKPSDLGKTESVLTIVGGKAVHALPPFDLH